MDRLESWLGVVTGSPVFQVLFGFAALMLLLLGVLSQVRPEGERDWPDSPERNSIVWLTRAGFILLPVFGVLFAASLSQVSNLWLNPPSGEDSALALRLHYLAIVGFIGVLGGILGALGAYLRLFTTERQTTAQEQGLITDRINKAVENLGATRTVKRQRRRRNGKLAYEHDDHDQPDFSKPIFEEVTKPNMEVRIGAIYALERIAQDSVRDHVQIMEILTAYVRENSKAQGARKSLHEVFELLTTSNGDNGPAYTPEEAFHHQDYKDADYFGWNPTELSELNLRIWADKILICRADISAAIKVIGRRGRDQIAREKRQGYRVDLSGSDLQGASLIGNFDHALFHDSRLDGAILDGTFNGAVFGVSGDRAREAASLQAARSEGGEFRKAAFSGANLDGAFFGGAQLDGASFRMARLRWTNFNCASLISCDFYASEAQGLYCYQSPDFSFSRFRETKVLEFRGLADISVVRLWIDQSAKNDLENASFNLSECMFAGEGNELSDRENWQRWISKESPDQISTNPIPKATSRRRIETERALG